MLGKVYCAIFNSSMLEGHVPEDWRAADVCALPKVNPPQQLDSDLRPISLTPIISKVMEGFVCKWIWDSIADKVNPDQYGCMKNTGTVHALINLVHHWSKATDKLRSFVRVLLLDFRKAFDHVDHSIVIQKLINLGVHGCLVRWVSSFLTNRRQRVKIGDILSSWVTINGGVPQGTKLAALLFLVMVNDLNTIRPMVKYVDDATVSEEGQFPRPDKDGTTKETPTHLQEDADMCAEWSATNNMSLNTNKTLEMVITFTKNQPDIPPIMINDIPIKRTDTTKLLGVHISSDLTWSTHISKIYSNAAKRLYSLIMLRRAGVPPGDMLHYYVSKVRPVTEYACQVWHSRLTKGDSALLETIQRRALKIIYRDDQEYDNHLTRAGLLKLSQRRENMCHKLFTQMQHPSHKLHNLLPKPRKTSISTRNSKKYDLPTCRTNRYKNSFVPFCLFNFQ